MASVTNIKKLNDWRKGMLKKSIPGIIKNAVCIGLAVTMVTGCGTAKAEEATETASYEDSVEEASSAESTIQVAPEENEITETEQDEADPVEISTTDDYSSVDSEEKEVSETEQVVFDTIELSAIKKESDVHYFEGTVDYNGETYTTDEFGYNALFSVFPIDREFHGQYLEWEGAEYVVLHSVLINDGYIYYTIDDRSEGQGHAPRLQLWKTPLTGGEPKLLFNTCYGGSKLALVQDQIVLIDFETSKTLVIDLDGNIKAEIAKDSHFLAATNEKIYVGYWNNGDIVALDYSGNELQRFNAPYHGYYGTVHTYNGAVIYVAGEDSYGAYLFPDEGTDFIEILDMQDKGFIYDLTDEGFYYRDGDSLCFYNSMDKKTTQLVNIDGNLDCVYQVGDKLIYETGRLYEHDNATDYMRTFCVYNLTTKENKVYGDYILLP